MAGRSDSSVKLQEKKAWDYSLLSRDRSTSNNHDSVRFVLAHLRGPNTFRGTCERVSLSLLATNLGSNFI